MIRLISAIILASAVITPSWASAATCENDPNECTPKNLCEMTTEIQGEQKVWTSKTEMSKHINFAKQLGMDCGASDPKDPCDLDANECKISELCERATTGEDNKKWNLDNPDHVRLAKEYSLSCEVSDEKKIENDNTCTYGKQQNCSNEELCQRASWANSKTGVRSWYSDNNVFVIEAKQRNLDCGVKSSKVFCGPDAPQACEDIDLCNLANTYFNVEKRPVFVSEAKTRGLNCNNACSISSPSYCDTQQLCELATNKNSGITTWKKQPAIFKEEAKKRKLSCGTFEYKLDSYRKFVSTDPEFKGDVQIYFHTRVNNKNRFYSKPNGWADFWQEYNWDKNYKVTLNTNTVFPFLKQQFENLSQEQREKLQHNLKSKGYYKSTVDGLWGRNTLLALVEYSSVRLRAIDLRSPTVVKILLFEAIRDTGFKKTTAKQSVLERVYSEIENQTKIQNKSPAFKSSFLNQSQLKRKQIQYALNKLGYYRSGIDGLWGNGTKNALTSFASAEGLGTSTPSTIFSRLLSKVSVPSSFAAPKKNNYSNNNRSNNQGLTPIISNPPTSASQALAVCEPQAKLAGSRAARAYQSPSYGSSINCNTYGSITNCRSSRSGGGGVLGGIAEGLGAVRVGKREQAAVLSSCLAQYGWRK